MELGDRTFGLGAVFFCFLGVQPDGWSARDGERVGLDEGKLHLAYVHTMHENAQNHSRELK